MCIEMSIVKEKETYSKFSLKEDALKESFQGWNDLPTGFQPSVLAYLINKSADHNETDYRIGTFLLPKLDDSGLYFKDIKYEKMQSLKGFTTPLQRKINVIAARHIPEPPSSLNILSRQVRMCLHDGNKVISNIHTVKARCAENSPKMWTFNLKVTSRNPSVEDGEIFLRSDLCVPTLGVFFELCLSYEVNSCVQEMSAGWAFMKLLDDSGEPVKSKTKILRVHDSEPFGTLSSQISSPGKSGLWQKVVHEMKLPRVVVSISHPDRKTSSSHISYLPSTLIGPWSCIQVIALCRKLMADDILHSASFNNTGFVFSPLLANIARVVNEPDLIDVLRICWMNESKVFEAEGMRTEQVKKKVFYEFFRSTVFPILHSNRLPPYIFGNAASEQSRRSEIERLLQLSDTLTLSKDVEVAPLNLSILATRICV